MADVFGDVPVGPATDVPDLFAALVDVFVMRTVETICRIEASVPQERRPEDMRRRLAEVRSRLDALEILVAGTRR